MVIKAKETQKPPYRRIVVKLGTSLLTGGGTYLNTETISRLVTQIARLHQQGMEIFLVSSGAIAAGRHILGLSRERRGTSFKQALASVGQNRLMNVYEQVFARHGITVAQALLTRTDLTSRAGYLNTRNTLLALLELKVLCIINENDVVAIDEIQESKFGDNDNLSAMVANLVDADLLLLLTDTIGLCTTDPKRHPDAGLIAEVKKIDATIEKLVTGTASELGVGGMATKIEAAKLATSSGATVIIADGREPDIILRLAKGEAAGTRFLPASSKVVSRKRWMLSGLCVRGKLMVDSGAATALKSQQRSLLPAGIKSLQGKFQRGDIVNIHDPQGTKIGCGITNYSSADIETITGSHSGQIAALLGYDYGTEVVHRNNLVIL